MVTPSISNTNPVMVVSAASENDCPLASPLATAAEEGVGAEEGFSTTVDGEGRMIVTGAFTETVDFGVESLTSDGGYDVFVLKL